MDYSNKPSSWDGKKITSRNLPKLIFQAEVPEEYIQSVPAQSLYMALRQNGMASSAELLETATLEQCRLMIDLDCWYKDGLVEDNLWEWLGACDAAQDLDLLHKIVHCIDLKLIAFLITRYVETHVFGEPTESPPDDGFYTPDKGCTWVKIETGDTHRNFLLARVLAAIFEKNADLFYQLLSISGVATPSQLEEEAYQEKQKRLAAEGIPEMEFAYKLNAPLSAAALLPDLKSKNPPPAVEAIPVVKPLVYDTYTLRPLEDILLRLEDAGDFESEFTLLMNAAMIRWGIEIYDLEQVAKMALKVKGAINLGLEELMRLSGLSAFEVYSVMGLKKLYGCGLYRLINLGKCARKLPSELLHTAGQESAAFAVVAGLREPFPEMPLFFMPNGTLKVEADGMLVKGYKAIEHLEEIESLSAFLAGLTA